MSKNWSEFGLKMLPRIVGCFLVLTIAWIGIFILDITIRNNWFKDINSLSNHSAVFTKSWLDNKNKAIKPLANDAHIRSALVNGDSAQNKQVKKTFYTFGYLNNIHNVYLFSKSSKVYTTKTATAKPLSEPLLNSLAASFEGEASRASQLIFENPQKFIYANKIYNSAGSNLGYIAYTEPLHKGISSLIKPLRHVLQKYNLSIFYKNANGYIALENVNYYSSKPQLILPGQLNIPIFENGKKMGIFENLRAEKVIAVTIPVPQYPAWKIMISRPTSEISDEGAVLRNLIKWIAAIASLVILLIGSLNNNPIRDIIRLIGKPKPKKPKKIVLENGEETEDSEKVIMHATGKYSEPKSQPFRYKEQTILEKVAHKKIEDIPPSEAEIVYAIKTCLRNKQLKFLYQPVMDSITQKPIMYEIYLRMFDEEGQMLAPALIFPAAEKNNLSSDIDAAVVGLAIERHLQNNRLATPLAINLTGATFESIHFLESLIQNISDKHIHGTKLIFELRSREIIKDKRAMQFIRNCHKLGCKFSIDYFGGGKKTIEAAKILKIDYIKVDGLEFNPETASTEKLEELKEVANACIELEIPLVMEKIETNEQIALCRRMRIQYVQGYKIAKPRNSIG